MGEQLVGGVANAGAVVREGDIVLRPAAPNHAEIHALLAHLHAVGFDAVPHVLGLEGDGRERLDFIPGDVPVLPFPAWSQTDEVLAGVGRLLRRYHDAVASFPPAEGSTWDLDMADPEGGPIVCHNDLCPENVVFRDGEAVALLDFDFAAPGRPLWDVATTARMWVPTLDPASATLQGRGGLDPFARLRTFSDAYGLSAAERQALPGLLLDSLDAGQRMVRKRLDAGHPAFVEMVEQSGGEQSQGVRREWLVAHLEDFARALA